MNRYYIIRMDDPNLKQISEVVVGILHKQEMTKDKDRCLIKLKLNDKTNYPFLEQYEELSKESVKIELRKEAWNYDLLNIS